MGKISTERICSRLTYGAASEYNNNKVTNTFEFEGNALLYDVQCSRSFKWCTLKAIVIICKWCELYDGGKGATAAASDVREAKTSLKNYVYVVSMRFDVSANKHNVSSMDFRSTMHNNIYR